MTLDERADELWDALLPYMQVSEQEAGRHDVYADKVKCLELIRDALTVEPEAGEVTVKPLEWYVNADNGDTLAKSIAGTYLIAYNIDDVSGEWLSAVDPNGEEVGIFNVHDLDGAKAVLQTDLYVRIRSAIAS